MNAPARAVTRRWPQRHHRGFSLIEVLITATVTVIAFTGLATLQLLSLRSATSALQRSQATVLAYDMVDRLRLNRGESALSGTALGGAYDDFSLCNDPLNEQPRCDVNTRDAVTSTDRVSLDLREWWSTLYAAGLPGWFAQIQRDQVTFTVAVQWDDTRAAGTDATEHTSCLGTSLASGLQEVCVTTRL